MLLLFCRYFAIVRNFSVSVTGMKYLLDHVHDLLAVVEPDVVVWDGHSLESDLRHKISQSARS